MTVQDLMPKRSRFGLRDSLPFTVILGLAASALVAITSNQTWARVTAESYVGDEIKRSSINGNIGDGEITLALSLAAVVLILVRLISPRITGFVLLAAVICLLVSAVTGMLNWTGIDQIPNGCKPGECFRPEMAVGWGLVTVTFASALGMASLAYQLWYDELR